MNELMEVFLEFETQEDGYDKWNLLMDFVAELRPQLTSYHSWVLVQMLMSLQELKEYLEPYIDVEI